MQVGVIWTRMLFVGAASMIDGRGDLGMAGVAVNVGAWARGAAMQVLSEGYVMTCSWQGGRQEHASKAMRLETGV